MGESFKFICCTLNTDNLIDFIFNVIPQRTAEELVYGSTETEAAFGD